MGGIIDYGVDVGTKTSPRSLAIEKAQEELRQEFDVREERRKELEFLEKVCLHHVISQIGFLSSLYLLTLVYCREATHWISNLYM
jgi:hypothetical protein